MVHISDGPTTWRLDVDFLRSSWECIWGRGCLGIGDEPDAASGLGCCSVGAVLADVEEARTVAALAATVDPGLFAHHRLAADEGVFSDGTRTATRVVDGACIFLNRPGFAGGAGCALHLAALAAGEAPREWKPSVCWQLPVRVDWQPGPEADTEVATLRRWTRKDWGEEGRTMAWCCTEGTLAEVGELPVVESLGSEIEALVGPDVYRRLRERLAGEASDGPSDRGPVDRRAADRPAVD